MNLDEALRDLADALAAGEVSQGRDARLRPARQILIDRCLAALSIEAHGHLTLHAAIRLAVEAPAQPARRSWAVLVVHALAVSGLIPTTSSSDVCALAEATLRDVLIRGGYPFGTSIQQRRHALERLHASIGELMQPLEPTFPNWQGLYAG